MKKRIAAIITGLLLLSVSDAQAQDRNNAATWFQRAIDAYGMISEDDRELVSEYAKNPDGPPPPAVQEVLRRSAAVIGHMRRGGEQEYNDFNLDYSQGFELILPHLQPLRDIGRLMMADAMMQLHRGDAQLAAERLGTIYKMSSHMGDDRILISSLVGQSIFSGSDGIVQMGLDRAAFGPGESAVLLRSMQRLAGDDPFNYLESVMGEQAIAVEWMDMKFGNQADRIRMAEQMEWITNSEEDAQRLASMTDEMFRRDLEKYDRSMDRVVEVFAMNDLEAGQMLLEQFEKEVESGELGFLAHIIMPSLLRVYEKKIEAKQTIDERIEVLSKLVTGEIEPEQEANAALYYLNGIELLSRMKPEQEAMLRSFVDRPNRDIDETLSALLVGASEVVDLFREGSRKQRCDFTHYRTRDDAALLPFYAAGMHNALRILYADAVRLYRASEIDAAVDRLVIIFRVAAHLSSDAPLVMPLIAHHAFARAEAVLGDMLPRSEFSDIHQLQLFDALDAMPRADPFGYIGSLIAARKAIVEELLQRSPALDWNDRKDVENAARDFNGDQLLHLQAIFDTMKRASEQGDAVPTQELATLDDLLDTVKLGSTRDDVPIVAPMIAQGELRFFERPSIPVYAKYVRQSRTARADLRAGLARLRPRLDE